MQTQSGRLIPVQSILWWFQSSTSCPLTLSHGSWKQSKRFFVPSSNAVAGGHYPVKVANCCNPQGKWWPRLNQSGHHHVHHHKNLMGMARSFRYRQVLAYTWRNSTSVYLQRWCDGVRVTLRNGCNTFWHDKWLNGNFTDSIVPDLVSHGCSYIQAILPVAEALDSGH